ncbi:MAG: hypothetical protein LBT79_02990 [Elusimicrobiota bacterium]|jgi:hypothetical protein|nr:hypothetical protein [Elusimicrobiota bacterium]
MKQNINKNLEVFTGLMNIADNTFFIGKRLKYLSQVANSKVICAIRQSIRKA